MNNPKRVLILAPHTDDGELGCGATISRLLREGAQIWYAAFSRCEESLPAGYPPDTLEKELYKATGVLGIPADNVCVKGYKVRHFSEHRQEILDDLITLNKEIKPDTVFLPSENDVHQDHNTIALEGLRAFKRKTIFAYELPWNDFVFHNQAFFAISEADAMRKIEALQQYETQKNRQYTKAENLLAVLRVHGCQIGTEYAEVFEAPRIVF